MKIKKLLFISCIALTFFNMDVLAHFSFGMKQRRFAEDQLNSVEEEDQLNSVEEEDQQSEEANNPEGHQLGRLIVAPESDVNDIFSSVIRAVPGLKEDSVTQDHCTGIPLQMYHKMVDYGRACRTYTDYRCFKACQFEKLGVSKDGIINLKKLIAHYDLFFIGQRPPTIEAIKKAAVHCFVKKDNAETFSTTNCAHNSGPLGCMHKHYYEICKPGENIPELKISVQ